jgi:hypothetical protein
MPALGSTEVVKIHDPKDPEDFLWIDARDFVAGAHVAWGAWVAPEVPAEGVSESESPSEQEQPKRRGRKLKEATA